MQPVMRSLESRYGEQLKVIFYDDSALAEIPKESPNSGARIVSSIIKPSELSLDSLEDMYNSFAHQNSSSAQDKLLEFIKKQLENEELLARVRSFTGDDKKIEELKKAVILVDRELTEKTEELKSLDNKNSLISADYSEIQEKLKNL